MSNLIQSKIARGTLWVTTVSLVSIVGYFIGWGAEDKYELTTIDTPSPEMKLEEQGRYDEAIQAVRNREGLRETDADSQVAQIYLDRAKKDPANREKWAQQAAFYLDKSTALAPRNPFILESAMDGFNKVGLLGTGLFALRESRGVWGSRARASARKYSYYRRARAKLSDRANQRRYPTSAKKNSRKGRGLVQ